MAEPKRISLWETGKAPYTEDSPGQKEPSLEAYPSRGARGAVVVVPGGGYTAKTPYEGAPIAKLFTSVGIAGFVLDYRVAPCHHKAPIADGLRAIKVLRSLGYEKTAIVGFSAGGHLTCAVATMFDEGDPNASDPVERFSSRPDAFIPCYAVASFGEYTHMGTRESLLGKYKNDEEMIKRYSTELRVTDKTPPAFIWHTATDDDVPVQNSLLVAKALADHHIPFELHVYPRGVHGLGLASEVAPASRWGADVCSWLLTLGFGA